MFEVALLYPDKQQGAAKRYGMPQDMGKDLNLSVILRAMAKEDEEIFTNCQRVLLCPVTDEKMLHFHRKFPHFFDIIVTIQDASFPPADGV